jgi:hypothetical protein
MGFVLLSCAEPLVVLPHVIVGPAALIRVRVLVVTILLATLAKVVLRVRDAVATATATTAVGTVLRMVRVAWTLAVCVAVLIPLNVMTNLL